MRLILFINYLSRTTRNNFPNRYFEISSPYIQEIWIDLPFAAKYTKQIAFFNFTKKYDYKNVRKIQDKRLYGPTIC